MKLQITGKNGLRIRQDTRQYIEKKMAKFSRFLTDSDDAKVEIRYEKTKSRQDAFIVQATIIRKGTYLRAEEKGNTIPEAADTVFEALERQIERYKTRHQKRAKGSPTVRLPESPTVFKKEEAAEYPEMPSPRIAKVKQFAVKRSTVDEAIDQMELLNHDFFLFVTNQNSVLSLVYKRKNGDYGIIEPEMA